jgi:peptide/nickel transport system substrate-binding protein
LWEHIDFQFRDDRLRKPFIRRAIATAIDRQAIVDEIIRPIDPDAQVLNNLLYGIEQPEYEGHFDQYRGDAAAARSILEDHGCTEAEDGIYRCDRRRLTFVYYTTAPNPIRKHLAEVVRAQLEAAGIEIEVRRRDPAIVFGRILAEGSYDLFNFAWVMTTIAGEEAIWQCRGSQNFMRYCNRDVDALLNEAVGEIDPARQARLANLADEAMARDLPALPLYQRPTFLAYRDRVQGLIDNPSQEGFTWNIEGWWIQP